MSEDTFLPARFELERHLGAGSCGSVYLARDRERGERVALKQLHHASPASLFRFKREFRSLSDLRHPNLLRLYELFSDDGWYFTMEAVDGRPITAVGRDPERISATFAQLARGLEALHAAGHLHRDLKPSNVLVDRDGRVVLLDFGLIGELDGSHSAEVVGTPLYASPEQVAGQPVGKSADWYAFGAMLFEALAGEPPFVGGALEVMVRKQRERAPTLASRARGTPKPLIELVDALLAEDPSARPGASEVRATLEGGAPASLALDETVEFVGREAEVDAIARLFEASRDTPRFAWVEGQSGVGKSALLHAIARQLEGQAFVLRGRCFQQESVPHEALDGVIDSLTHLLMTLPRDERSELIEPEMEHATLLFPVLGRVPELALDRAPVATDAPRRREAAVRGLRRLLGALCALRPVAMLIDDLQWADADSAALLRELVGGESAPGLFVVGAFRPTDRGRHPFFRALPPAVTENALSLAPLSEERTISLARRLLSGAGEDTLRGVAAESGGLPFLVEQLCRHARRGARAELSASQVVLERFSRLGEAERAWLEPLALSQRPIDAETLAEVIGATGVADMVDRLRRDRWLQVHATERGKAVEIYHDRLADAVRGAIPGERATALHAALATAFRARETTEAETVAFHLERAGRLAEARLYIERAGRDAMQSLAWERAIRLFQRGLELVPAEAEPAARQLRVALGDALAGAGRGREAAEVYRVACRGAERELVLELERRVADQLLRAGHVEDGYRAFDAVLEAVGERQPSGGKARLASLVWHRARLKLRGLSFDERAEADCHPAALRRVDVLWSAGVGSSLLDSVRGADFLARSLLAALDVGEPRRVARSLAYEACFVSNRGRPGQAIGRERLEQSRRIAEQLDDDYLRALTFGARCVVDFHGGHWRRAVEAAELSERVFQRQAVGFQREVSSIRFFWMVANVLRGELGVVARRQSELLRIARERGDLFAAANFRSGFPNQLLLADDDLEGARKSAVQAIRAWPVAGFHLQHFFDLFARASHELYGGEGEQALAVVETRWKAYQGSMLGRLEFVRVVAEDLRARATLAAMSARPFRRASRRRAVSRRIAKLESERVLWADASASMLRACLARLEGDEAAVAYFAEAAARYEQAEMSVHALVARRAGLAAAGRPTDEPDAALRALGVKAPARYARMLAPGEVTARHP